MSWNIYLLVELFFFLPSLWKESQERSQWRSVRSFSGGKFLGLDLRGRLGLGEYYLSWLFWNEIGFSGTLILRKAKYSVFCQKKKKWRTARTRAACSLHLTWWTRNACTASVTWLETTFCLNNVGIDGSLSPGRQILSVWTQILTVWVLCWCWILLHVCGTYQLFNTENDWRRYY